MDPVNFLHVSAYTSEYNERFGLKRSSSAKHSSDASACVNNSANNTHVPF